MKKRYIKRIMKIYLKLAPKDRERFCRYLKGIISKLP